MPEFLNSFAHGMNLDVDKLRQQPETYRNALNVRLETQEDGTRGALVNLGGNKFQFSFPTTSNVSEITLSGIPPTTFSFLVNSITLTVSNITATTFFQTVSKAINSNATLQALGITSAYSLTHLTVWSKVNALNQTISANINLIFTVANVVVNNAYILAQVGIEPIGWATVRDELVFLTTNNKTINPGGHDFDPSVPTNPSSVGQIWKYNYTPGPGPVAGQLTLLYNNITDFTTYHSIPQTAIIGRYENPVTKKIYWSDFFSQVRNFNIADPNGFALNPVVLSRKPDVIISRPILQAINDVGGQLYTGNYQAVYRLKLNTGAVTRFFELSNSVSIFAAPSIDSFVNFVGDAPATLPTLVTTKTITWDINPVDTNFDRIEIAIVKRLNVGTIYGIDIIREDPIPKSGNYQFTYNGHETTIPIDLNELVAIPGEFTHAKTLSSKDNLLIVANVRSENFDVDFDARAYRFNSQIVIGQRYAEVQDYQGGAIDIQAATLNWSSVPIEHDAINPDQSTQTATSYRFQSDGITLGGEGQNIKYTFKTKYIVDDQNLAGNGFGGMPLDTGNGPLGFDGRFILNGGPDEVIDTVNYPNNSFLDGFKSPYKASALKGYQHDEVYRFGIVFYSPTGTPSFAKWIGDIRMPLMFEGGNDYSISKIQTFGAFKQQVVGILYPEFQITIPQAIKNQISGYSIIRLPRKQENKTVLAAGTLHPVEFDSFGGKYWGAMLYDYDGIGMTADINLAGFHSPEFTFATTPARQSGDTMKIIGTLTNSYSVVSTNPAPPDEFHFNKNYTVSNSGVIEEPIIETTQIQRGGVSTIAGLAITNTINPTYGIKSVGDRITILNWKGGTSVTPIKVNNDKYYALYKRSLGTVLTSSQYGGSSYTQRSDNEYEDCGQFQPIPLISTQLVFTTDVFGGDIYTAVWDTQRIIKGWTLGAGTYKSSTFWLPNQSTINTEWRFGTFVNRNGLNNNNTAVDTGEDYLFNGTYEQDNNIKMFVPKPSTFQNISEFDSRFWSSQVKINGETNDHWLTFSPNDYWDVESVYGPVNAIFNFNNQLMFLQDKAFGIQPVNQRVLIQDNSAGTLQLGTGDRLTKHTYITTRAGAKHQNGVVLSANYIYFFDIYTKRMYRFGQGLEQQSELEGVSAFLENNLTGDIVSKDNPTYKDPLLLNARSGIMTGTDKRFNEVLFTFYQSSATGEKTFTIVYNELLKCYQGFTSFSPSMYVSDQFNLFSPNTASTSQMWIHNQTNYGSFYGTVFPTTVSLIVNPEVSYNKVYDNVSFYTEILDGNVDQQLETFSSIRFFTDYQNTDFITLDPITTKNIKRKERTWNTTVARNVVDQTQVNMDIFNPINLLPAQLFKNRLRDKIMTTDLSYNNLKGRKLILHWIKTIFRVSIR